MKKIIILFCLFIAFSSYSQNEKEMLDAGIKKGTVKKIFKSFSGDIFVAIDRWAVTGSGKLSKKFIKSAEKLGIDKIYLGQKLKDARKVRMNAIAAGLSGAAAGYAAAAVSAHAGDAATMLLLERVVNLLLMLLSACLSN